MANKKIEASDLNDLFTQLETIRQEHAAAGGLTTDQANALANPYNTTPAQHGMKPSTDIVSELKSDVENIENSPYIGNTFSSQITIPSVGELLRLAFHSELGEIISGIDGCCPNCAFFTSAASQGFFTSNFTSVSSQGFFTSDFTTSSQKGNFTSASSRGFFTTDFSSPANNGNFTANFSSPTNKGNFTANFSSPANKGNFTSLSQKGNFTSATSKGNFLGNFTSSTRMTATVGRK